MAEATKEKPAPLATSAAPPAPKPAMRHEPIKAIVERFLGEIQVHPDANLLSFAQGGGIPPGALLAHLSSVDQQLIALRFVMRKN